MRITRSLLPAAFLTLIVGCTAAPTEPANTHAAGGSPRLSVGTSSGGQTLGSDHRSDATENELTAAPDAGTTVVQDTTGRAGPGLGSGH